MGIYITDSRIPELVELPPEVARAVVHRAKERMHSDSKLLSWLPTILCILGTPIGSFVGLWLGCSFGIWVMPLGHVQTSFLSFPGMVAGGLVAGFTGKQTQIPKLRAYIRQTITEFAGHA